MKIEERRRMKTRAREGAEEKRTAKKNKASHFRDVSPSGLMDKASASEAGDCGFKSHLGRFFSILSNLTVLNILSSIWIVSYQKSIMKILNEIIHTLR